MLLNFLTKSNVFKQLKVFTVTTFLSGIGTDITWKHSGMTSVTIIIKNYQKNAVMAALDDKEEKNTKASLDSVCHTR